jgi:hypothetical protein
MTARFQPSGRQRRWPRNAGRARESREAAYLYDGCERPDRQSNQRLERDERRYNSVVISIYAATELHDRHARRKRAIRRYQLRSGVTCFGEPGPANAHYLAKSCVFSTVLPRVEFDRLAFIPEG